MEVSGLQLPIEHNPSINYEHINLMQTAGCNIHKLIELRRDIHKHPEGGFQEFETQKKLKAALFSYGIEEENIKVAAKTGLVVDIQGKGEVQADNKGIKMIALRADMDALPIPENNPDLEYKTTNSWAHMCGHDGHMTTLLAAAQVIANNRDKMPSDKTVRLLLQPAEEGPGGALPMIKEDNCLQDVDEVYGFHNVPNFLEGEVRVVSGPIMAQVSVVRINVVGRGGHGSLPHLVNDVITASAFILNNLHTIKSRCIHNKENFVFTICQVDSGFTHNVFPDKSFMQGTIRSYNNEVLKKIKEKIVLIAETTAETYGCKATVDVFDMYPATINHPTETQHIQRLAKQHLGEHLLSEQDLPLTASEDFSYFLEEKPGCFYMLGLKRPTDNTNKSLHTSNYDFNDDMIAYGGYFYTRIVEDRLDVKLF
ncbi:amidohydrolase [Stylonychia lemnae]|uniref:Amidohydrolase n=1 Tax=Stylonychia lemnae TaxID=5949 RepID=A0A078ANK0_STYLE|nr:amidohydrolase [Stylonychia lemnae]|eukprot:CDW83506.1 amidohydrolase [Stylonychia lemnae]